jgi:hypothetical protein
MSTKDVPAGKATQEELLEKMPKLIRKKVLAVEECKKATNQEQLRVDGYKHTEDCPICRED